MSETRTAWTTYIVLRLLFFAVPFGVLYLIGMRPWVAALFAALIGAALSVILLSKQRATASESIYDWRHRDRTADDIVEDEAVEAAETAPRDPSPADPAAAAPVAEPPVADPTATDPAAAPAVDPSPASTREGSTER